MLIRMQLSNCYLFHMLPLEMHVTSWCTDGDGGAAVDLMTELCTICGPLISKSTHLWYFPSNNWRGSLHGARFHSNATVTYEYWGSTTEDSRVSEVWKQFVDPLASRNHTMFRGECSAVAVERVYPDIGARGLPTGLQLDGLPSRTPYRSAICF